MRSAIGGTLACLCACMGSLLSIEDIPTGSKDEQEEVLLPCLQGLLLSGSGPERDRISYQEISFDHFDLPGLEKELADQLSSWIGQPLTPSSLCRIKESIALFFMRHHRPVILILVPEQEITDGRLHLQVVESRLGEIRACQNNWFGTEKLLSQVQLCKGEPINARVLSQDLRWLNRNPFREIDAIFTPGIQPYTTDVELLVRDRFPLRVFTGADNTGIPITGRTRYVAGFQASNFFKLDHVLLYQFSSGNSYPDFHSHFLQYTWPLPWRHVMDFYGAYARTMADHKDFFNRGNSYLGSFRYTIPLNLNGPWWVSELVCGLDFKRTNNNLLFSDKPEFTKDVNLTQFVASGRLGYRGSCQQFLLSANLYASPGNFTGVDGDRHHFELLRPGANNRYAYLNSAFFYQLRLPRDFSWTADLRGQIASAELLPSEQFGIGGYNSVRGFNEHEENRDNALLLNTEIRSPRIPLLDRWQLRCYPEGLQFLLFLDCGTGTNHGESWKGFKTLAGFGPGIRYVIDPYLTVRLDWGIELNPFFEHKPFKSRLHFALFFNLW